MQEDQGRRPLPPMLYPVFGLVFGGALVWSFSRILLSIGVRTFKFGGVEIKGASATAAIALLMALNVLVGGALVAYGGRVRRRPASFPLLMGAGVAVIAAGLVAQGIGVSPVEEARAERVTLVAQGLAFSQRQILLSAGARVTVTFENRDAGIQHNFVLFAGATAGAPVLFRGPLVTGTATITYTFTAPRAGTYFFHCDIHPTQMTGTVTVAPPGGATRSGGGGGGGGGGPGVLQVAAQNLSFSPTSLAVRSGGQVTIRFTNADAGVAHDIVVFGGRDASAPPLFTGQAVTGPGSVTYTFATPPPGTYFFHCQFHPTQMTGTITVT